MNQPTNGTLEKLTALRNAFRDKFNSRRTAINQVVETLCEAQSEHDWKKAAEELKGISHKLAGASGTFGFPNITNISEELEILSDKIIKRSNGPTPQDKETLSLLIKKMALEEVNDTTGLHQITQWESFSKTHFHDEEAPSQKISITLVEDDLELANSLKEQLTYFGFDITILPDVSLLENQLSSSQPTILIMDVSFPGDADGGVKEVKRLQNENKLSCPVIFLSMRSDMEARLSAVRLGCIGYFIKPTNTLDLIELINKTTQRGVQKSFKAVIVDDDEEVAIYNEELLSKAGFETLVITDPLQAIDPIQEFGPDVMLIDIQMPNCNGFELSQVIRQDNKYLQVPIVFLTGQNIEDAWFRTMESGGDEFIRKSAPPKEMIAAVTGRAKRARKLNQIINSHAENEARYSALADASQEGFVTIDDKLNIINWNKAAENLLGYHANEIIGKPTSILFPDKTTEDENHFMNLLKDNNIQSMQGKVIETERLHKDGRKIPVEISYTSWKIHNKTFTTGIVRDITARQKSERALKQSEAKNRSIIENSAEGIISIDAQSIINTFNPAAEKMFGYSAQEIIGQKVSELVPSAERISHDRYVTQSQLHAPRIINNARDLYGRRKDGSLFPMELTVSGMEIDDAKMFVGIMRDISERKKTEQALKDADEKTRQLLDTAAEGIYGLDADGITTFINPAACKMLGYDQEELIGKLMHTTVHHSYPDGSTYPKEDCFMYAAFRDGQVYQINNEVLWRKDGTSFPVKYTSSPIWKNGKTVGAVINFNDITNEVEAQNKLEAAKVEAERANKAKSEFLSSMSHELRTPMNAIIGFGQMLEFNERDPLSPAQKKCVDHILSGGKHLLDLINEVLDLSRIEAGKLQLNLEELTLGEIIKECLNLSETLASKRNIELNFCENCNSLTTVFADRVRLKQVILNLLSNAIKYNNLDGKVTINCSLPDPLTRRVSITDTGDGIPLESQKHLFSPFNRLGAESTEIEGTGIGLALTKNLVKAMNGNVDFVSSPGKGSTFWIDIPITEQTPINTQSEHGTQSANVPKEKSLAEISGTLLYVEDNPANMDLMKLVISQVKGLKLLTAMDGEEGIKLALKSQPDIIILDINLPGLNGFEVLKKLQSTPETKNTPIFALSASAMPSEVEKGLEAGFQQYLSKPFDVTKTLDAIKSAIKEKKND